MQSAEAHGAPLSQHVQRPWNQTGLRTVVPAIVLAARVLRMKAVEGELRNGKSEWERQPQRRAHRIQNCVEELGPEQAHEGRCGGRLSRGRGQNVAAHQCCPRPCTEDNSPRDCYHAGDHLASGAPPPSPLWTSSAPLCPSVAAGTMSLSTIEGPPPRAESPNNTSARHTSHGGGGHPHARPIGGCELLAACHCVGSLPPLVLFLLVHHTPPLPSGVVEKFGLGGYTR